MITVRRSVQLSICILSLLSSCVVEAWTVPHVALYKHLKYHNHANRTSYTLKTISWKYVYRTLVPSRLLQIRFTMSIPLFKSDLNSKPNILLQYSHQTLTCHKKLQKINTLNLHVLITPTKLRLALNRLDTLENYRCRQIIKHTYPT